MRILLALVVAGLIAACDPVPSPSVTPSESPSTSPTTSVEPSGEATPTPEPSVSAEPSVEPTESPTPSASPSDEPVALEFVGAGTDTTEEFSLPNALYLVEWEVTNGPCTADFTLLLDDYGDRYPIGHAETNTTDSGEQQVALPQGWYKLEVKDPGCEWTVSLTEQ